MNTVFMLSSTQKKPAFRSDSHVSSPATLFPGLGLAHSVSFASFEFICGENLSSILTGGGANNSLFYGFKAFCLSICQLDFVSCFHASVDNSDYFRIVKTVLHFLCSCIF